jgi:hypothetical protein
METAKMRAAAITAPPAKAKQEEMETYEVTAEDLATLQDKGEVTLEGGCVLKLTDANEEENETEAESEAESEAE